MKYKLLSICILLALIMSSDHVRHDGEVAKVRTSALPWVTVFTRRGETYLYDVTYLTDNQAETVLAASSDESELKKFLGGLRVKRRENGDLIVIEGNKSVDVFCYQGKAPGSTAKYGDVWYLSTLHRKRLTVETGQTLYYAVFDGNKFSKPFAIRAPGSDSLKAFHVGHTSSIYRWSKGVVHYFPKTQLKRIVDGIPNLVLHSGDFMVSPYNLEELKRETLGRFGDALGSLPLLISASNHDQGWPQTGIGEGWLFRHLLKFRYYRGTLNFYCDYGPFRFIMLNYVEMGRPNRMSAMLEMMDSWTASKRPTIIVWGGSKKNLWSDLQKYVAEKPHIRLILGGDGASHEVVKLPNGAYQIQNDVFDLIELDMNSKKIELVVHRNLRRDPQVRISIDTKWDLK